jgi:hypothetical protein
MEPFLYWSPRVLGIVLTAFISLFALDVFEHFTLIGFLMHLVPTAIALAVLLIAWRWEAVGGCLYLLIGVIYIVMAWGRFPLLTYMLVVGPIWLVGGLFLCHHFVRRPAA